MIYGLGIKFIVVVLGWCFKSRYLVFFVVVEIKVEVDSEVVKFGGL